MRLFYAVRVPPEVAARLSEAQRDLRGNWRRVAPDQLHVTLAYLPNVHERDLDALRALGRDVARVVPPFTARLRGTGYFPNEGSPRVWFVKVDAPELDLLAQGLRDGLTARGTAFDDKPFKAHVTLARKKGPAPRVAPRTFDLEWEARNVQLVRSVLHKTGPEYDTVGTYRLAGPRQADNPDTTEPVA
ncbi:RNA 2',3'-cyclic phosphodiesterase [Deinococcus pimensis]|uniref:RNA 2',3'-cyclic phosphodiesterase n=1 Tax=Deinococcus pimensis TaxID=309888 RepID=UPI0004822803|nr:RNA 2',3'-cyclic phosphodiesterase [Deinococcus pimensis]